MNKKRRVLCIRLPFFVATSKNSIFRCGPYTMNQLRILIIQLRNKGVIARFSVIFFIQSNY